MWTAIMPHIINCKYKKNKRYDIVMKAKQKYVIYHKMCYICYSHMITWQREYCKN